MQEADYVSRISDYFTKLDYLQCLSVLHKQLKPEVYLEIGVDTGLSLRLSEAKTTIGIDPVIKITQPSAQLFQMRSDSFFNNPHEVKSIDLAFIDGMHLYDYALRDLIYVEALCHSNSVVAVHDCLPVHPDIATRKRQTNVWTGDVWKLLLILKTARQDLQCLLLKAKPSGLLLIKSLKSHSTVLKDAYAYLVNSVSQVPLPPLEEFQHVFPVAEATEENIQQFVKAGKDTQA